MSDKIYAIFQIQFEIDITRYYKHFNFVKSLSL